MAFFTGAALLTSFNTFSSHRLLQTYTIVVDVAIYNYIKLLQFYSGFKNAIKIKLKQFGFCFEKNFKREMI